MKIEVIIDGDKYFGKVDVSMAPSVIAESLFEETQKFNRLKMELVDGSFLILPKEIIQRTIFIVRA